MIRSLPVCLLWFPFYNIHDGFRRASCSCSSATRSDPERESRRADWDWGAIPNPDCRAALLGSFLSGYHPSLVGEGAPPFLGRLDWKKENPPVEVALTVPFFFSWSAPNFCELLRRRETIPVESQEDFCKQRRGENWGKWHSTIAQIPTVTKAHRVKSIQP